MSAQRIGNIYHGKRIGTFTISDEKVAWQPSSDAPMQQSTDQQSFSMSGKNITHAEWTYAARGYLLRIWKEKVATEFSGFQETDFEVVRDALDAFFKVKLVQIELDGRGINWGDLSFHKNGSLLVFNNTNKTRLFDIALDSIKNCTKTPKSNELILEFHEDSVSSRDDDVLSEVRFAFPKDDTEDDEDSRLDVMRKAILNKADVITATGEAIVSFDQMPFLAPRGRYVVDMYRKFFRMHGRTYDFKVPYNSISVMFLLDKPDGHKYFIISLDVPVRTGKTPLYHLVLNFDSSKELNDPKILSMDDDEIESKYPKKGLKQEMHGMEFEVVAKVFRALTGKKLIGAGKFNTSTGDKGIRCSVKADEGYLFVLEKSFLFLHKPTVYLRHEEIRTIRFDRADSMIAAGGHGTRSFDITFILRNSKRHTFNNIARSEYDPLVNYFKAKRLNTENLIEEQAATYADLGDDDDDESDDEDFAEEDDDEDDDAEFRKYVTDGVEADEVAPSKGKRKRTEGDEDFGDADEDDDEETSQTTKKRRTRG